MDEYINQLRKTIKAELPYFSLMGTLVLIDICSALDSQEGETNKSKFKQWFVTYVSSSYSNKNHFEGFGSDYSSFNRALSFNAEECYKLRCRLLHQGRTEIDHKDLDKTIKNGKIVFSFALDMCNCNGYYYLNIEKFMENVIKGVYKWEKETMSIPFVKENKKKMLKIFDYDPGGAVCNGGGPYIY